VAFGEWLCSSAGSSPSRTLVRFPFVRVRPGRRDEKAPKMRLCCRCRRVSHRYSVSDSTVGPGVGCHLGCEGNKVWSRVYRWGVTGQGPSRCGRRCEPGRGPRRMFSRSCLGADCSVVAWHACSCRRVCFRPPCCALVILPERDPKGHFVGDPGQCLSPNHPWRDVPSLVNVDIWLKLSHEISV
jgi:hypothetical protein